jgi:hypothetical protein
MIGAFTQSAFANLRQILTAEKTCDEMAGIY